MDMARLPRLEHDPLVAHEVATRRGRWHPRSTDKRSRPVQFNGKRHSRHVAEQMVHRLEAGAEGVLAVHVLLKLIPPIIVWSDEGVKNEPSHAAQIICNQLRPLRIWQRESVQPTE